MLDVGRVTMAPAVSEDETTVRVLVGKAPETCRPRVIPQSIFFGSYDSLTLARLCFSGSHVGRQSQVQFKLPQVRLYLNWVRYAIDVVMKGRTFVVINMDETSINSVEDSGCGLRGRVHLRQRVQHRGRDAEDRSNVKTSLLATVCDSAALQPLLPQIILPKYTKRATPPQSLRTTYAATGEPLEYWHRTGGWATTDVIKRWATRMRSAIHSFNPDAWIILVWDCSQTHLNLQVANHLRLLGILAIMLPAKLTWLLQVCDVCVFREFKQRLRMHKSFLRLATPDGRLRAGDWISCCGGAVREIIVSRSWEDAFDRMGLGADVASIKGRVRRAIDVTSVGPALPTRAQFGRMVNKVHHTEAFARLHHSIVGHFLHVQRLPVGTPPRRGAVVPSPDVAPAQKKRRAEAAGPSWEEAIQSHLSTSTMHVRMGAHGRAPATNREAAVAPAL